MDLKEGSRIAVIGAGISGIAAANILRKNAFVPVIFENARSCAVSTRFQQYIDILLMELEVSPYRKLPNPFAELFSRYEASDYEDIYEEYEQAKSKRTTPLHTLPLDT
jgi:cation diffusion facilitator CzcD-associated flavoprotein CzcO